MSFHPDTTCVSLISRSGLSSFCHRVSLDISSSQPQLVLWTTRRPDASTLPERSLVSSTRCIGRWCTEYHEHYLSRAGYGVTSKASGVWYPLSFLLCARSEIFFTRGIDSSASKFNWTHELALFSQSNFVCCKRGPWSGTCFGTFPLLGTGKYKRKPFDTEIEPDHYYRQW